MLPTTVFIVVCEYLNHSDRFRLAAIAQLPFILTATARGASHRDDDFVSVLADPDLLDILALHPPSAFDALPLAIEAAVVDRASALGRVAVLELWRRRRGADIPCTTAAVDDASGNGHVEVLQWWRQRWREREQPPPEIPYTRHAFEQACVGAKWDVMEWWRRSGLRVLCSDRLLDMVSAEGRLDVLRWLKEGKTGEGSLSTNNPWTFRYASSYNPNDLDFNPVTVSWHRSAENELEIHKDGLLGATRNGHLRVLLWWQQTLKSNFPRKIPGIMDEVSKSGRLEMLEFWRRSGVKLSYTSEAVDGASERGDLQVLQWWAASGLKVLYSEKAMDRASANHHLHVLNWWSSSRFTLEYSINAMDSASGNGHVAVLQWWKDTGVELKYSALAIHGATLSGHVNVLQWWMDSGLEIKYVQETVDEALSGDPAVAEWWLAVGLPTLKEKMVQPSIESNQTPSLAKSKWSWWG